MIQAQVVAFGCHLWYLHNPFFLCQAVASGAIRIVPDRFEKVYNQWLENIRDWCISRQLWWGHRIPVWYVFPDEATAVASDGIGGDYVVARDDSDALRQAQERYVLGNLHDACYLLELWLAYLVSSRLTACGQPDTQRQGFRLETLNPKTKP